MIVSALPIWFVDMAGSVLMILFSFMSIRLVRLIYRNDPNSIIWTYLTWVCYCLAGFAISRSAGHILKQILFILNLSEVWNGIRPFSGSINTFMLIVVSSVTLFFQRAWHIYQEISRDKQALQTAHTELLSLNQNLEQRVKERTEALARHEKQMAQADKLASIGQLSSGIAHEINNPLGIILGYTQLLLRSEEPESQKYEDLKTIEKHVKSCKTTVEDLLNFARSSKPKKEFFNIHETIDDVLNFVRHRSDMHGMFMERRYGPEVPRMLMDEKKIKQVLINLLMNAKHAVGETGTITVSTAYDTERDRVSVMVQDTGYGIEEKNISRIFDPFFTTKPTGEGTGLGLAVSYGIVKTHGGDLLVESEPGKGSTFTMVLPAGGKSG
ncbi:MAG: sensor histidine kinase [Thermodesulfobacteriota bacterium]